MGDAASLEELFRLYQSLPASGEERARDDLVQRIIATISGRLGEGDVDRERDRPVRDATARLGLLAPGTPAFDEAILRVIEAARTHLGPDRLDAVAEPSRRGRSEPGLERDVVNEASEGSFPASDAPGYAGGGG